MEPVKITNLKALQERIKQGRVITVTRGTFAIPTAHTPDCPAVKQIRIPHHPHALLVDAELRRRRDHPRSRASVSTAYGPADTPPIPAAPLKQTHGFGRLPPAPGPFGPPPHRSSPLQPGTSDGREGASIGQGGVTTPMWGSGSVGSSAALDRSG